MEKEIKSVFIDFVNECTKRLSLYSVVQFGSSTHAENFEDIDSLFVSKEEVILSKDYLIMIEIIKNFEILYPEIVFDFGGQGRINKKAKYSITLVFIGKGVLSTKHNPDDLFFFNLLSSDKNIKVLFGNNPFEGKDFLLTNQHMFEKLSVTFNRVLLRNTLENEDNLIEGMYFSFKTFLRGMLVHRGHFEKNELLGEFEKEYFGKISLPENAQKLINHKIKLEDFERVLNFTENCLKYLCNHK